jgi:hypothetical protein
VLLAELTYTDGVREQCGVCSDEFGADETSESLAEAAGDSEGVAGPRDSEDFCGRIVSVR